MKPNQFTAEQVIRAIRGSRGIKSAIAKRLQCNRRTVDNYIARFPTVKEAYEEEREATVDIAELELMKHLNAGSLPAIFFVLKTIGKDRGYVERQELNINLQIVNKLVHLLEEQGHDASRVFNDMVAELIRERVTGE